MSGSGLVKEVYDGVYKKAELGKLGKENVRINKIRVLFFLDPPGIHVKTS